MEMKQATKTGHALRAVNYDLDICVPGVDTMCVWIMLYWVDREDSGGEV